MNNRRLPSSFRDPSGFLFFRDGSLYRQVNTGYRENYDHLMNSGLYETLVGGALLIPHQEVDVESNCSGKVYKIIKPELIPFVSYPYEWCFSQLKDAALATLDIQRRSLDVGMSLKDCSAYNIQSMKGRPVLIDTLSFERYRDGQPWVAYRQFCQHFLAPLALMSYRDIRLNQLLKIYLDGIPLDLTSSLLTVRTRFVFSLLSHIHLHAKSQKYFADKTVDRTAHKMTRQSLLGLIDSLESAVRRLKWDAKGTEWANYYRDSSYSPSALEHKRQLVSQFLDTVHPRTVWDLGANVGMFSRVASKKGICTVSFDIDPAAVEKNYIECVKRGETNILPLVLDLTNPSPSIGWENKERMSIFERGPADMVLALALVHHLAISNNLPFNELVSTLSTICSWLAVEFVPKSDPQVARLLSTRDDIFPDYTQQTFESEFRRQFTIMSSVRIRDSERMMYLMRRKGSP
ncbi:hypothetical protein LCGC14_1004510 [marine sediment metagenome]|uniref:SAM-dependent methyltransferase n=1 Tax=marine sediment metagenome TaxID=412755 RepID=A0A0F9N263_9ZZZZ